MNKENILVRNYMKLSSAFVYENDTLFNVLESMKKYKIENVSIIKDDLSIVGGINKKKIMEILTTEFQNNIDLLKKKKIKEIPIKYDFPIMLYPRMTLIDAHSMMKCFNVRGLPVVNLPWEKKIIGFLWIDDVLPIIEEYSMKISSWLKPVAY